MIGYLSLYLPSYVPALVYMLQNSEYQIKPYLSWYWRTNDFRTVMHRRTLEATRAAQALLFVLYVGILFQSVLGILSIWMYFTEQLSGGWLIGLGLLLTAPIVWAHVVIIPLWLARRYIVAPKQQRLIRASQKIFSAHPAQKIAIAGSYGKTTMKELLATVLAEGKIVAATPANKNVAISHAIFAHKLRGNEEVLIIEYGEGKPGDVKSFTHTTKPTIGIITGIAPAHLDHYASVAEAAEDIFSLAEYLKGKNVFVNTESPEALPYVQDSYHSYDRKRVMGWTISNIAVGFDGVTFKMKRGNLALNLHSPLLGRHQVGPLAVAVAIAHDMGLSVQQICAGIAKTVPFEHRLQPRQLNGAWLIDDTYNGNIEGIRAGLALLHELPARRKIYVTPGLVEQGRETERVHIQMGLLIAESSPDEVIIMKNSVTESIKAGLKKGGFAGILKVEEDPLLFYSSIDQFIAAGDVVLMQNDWTDNYA